MEQGSTNRLIWIWILRISNPMNPLKDSPDQKSEFGFAERNVKSVLKSKILFWIHRKDYTLRLAQQQHCTCITLFCTFLSRRYTTTTWKCLTSRFVDDENTGQQLSFSFPELWSSFQHSAPKKFANIWPFGRVGIRAMKFEAARHHFFKWRFRSRRRRCCLSSLLIQPDGRIHRVDLET